MITIIFDIDGTLVESMTFDSELYIYERVSIMKMCKEHISPLEDNAVYVGDGPWDLEAARELQWGFIGIGQRLKESAEVWISDYRDESWIKAPKLALSVVRSSHR